ncbi:hypothetical protein [Sorangium sp. So ce693]|uniref:hypothetical protein n=1 Tax=unclassified Sorangium TaxID=2621164 RepID=UPI003F61667B
MRSPILRTFVWAAGQDDAPDSQNVDPLPPAPLMRREPNRKQFRPKPPPAPRRIRRQNE